MPGRLSAALTVLALLSAASAQTEAQPAPATPAPVAAPATNPAATAPATVPVTGSVSTGSLFAALATYPALTQARLAVQAARTQQQAADFPVAASISASDTLILNADGVPETCSTNALLQFTSYCAPLPGSIQTVNAAVRALPLNVGDTGARRALARLGVTQAELGYQTALSNLEGQAVLAAQRARLAAHSLELAQASVQAAQMAVQATQTRVSGGGATEADLAQAQLTLAQAQSGAQQAQDNVRLAAAALTDLTGQAAAPDLPELTPPASGQSAAVTQAQFAVQRAQIAYGQVKWNSLPNVQLAYTHNFTGSTNTAGVGVAVDSRNLAPALTLSYAPVAPPQSRVNDQLTLGVSFDASAAALAAPGLAQNAVQQAQAGLDTAQRQAALQLDSLNAGYAQALRQRDLTRQAQALAQQTAQTATQRRDLGLVSPLEAAQAAVAAYQAQLAADQAALNLTDAASRIYTFLGQPLAALN